MLNRVLTNQSKLICNPILRPILRNKIPARLTSTYQYSFAHSGKHIAHTKFAYLTDRARTESALLKPRVFQFSTAKPSQNTQQRGKGGQEEEYVEGLSFQQKLYFVQAAGFLFLFNVAVRLSLSNDSQIDSHQRKL